MKEFSHPGSEDKMAVDLNRAIENTITVARNEWKYVADVVSDLDASLPHVPCLPGELNQVFLNLIVNAAHAIGENLPQQAGGKGVITVRFITATASAPASANNQILHTWIAGRAGQNRHDKKMIEEVVPQRVG